jgi:hypothetical protein
LLQQGLELARDLNLETHLAKVFVRGEYTKTKTDRSVFLTEEVVSQLEQYLEYKEEFVIKMSLLLKQSRNIERHQEKIVI